MDFYEYINLLSLIFCKHNISHLNIPMRLGSYLLSILNIRLNEKHE